MMNHLMIPQPSQMEQTLKMMMMIHIIMHVGMRRQTQRIHTTVQDGNTKNKHD